VGGGLVTCRKLIDVGWIAKPIGARAFMGGHGREQWYPDPAFYHQEGGCPLFDLGTFYLTARVHLLGHVQSMPATGFGRLDATA
jgi:predicted dehydrogenase